MASIPELNSVHRSYKDQGLVLIGIHCDDWEKGLAAVKDKKVEYAVANDDDQKSQDAYKVYGFPTVFVIDKKGIIRHIDPPDLGEAVKELLAE